MGYRVTSGVIHSPVKVVIYGPEGVGKSSFAAQFPNAVFLDTEGGTERLNVYRLPRPTSWAMLLDECDEVRKGNVACTTLVIDTADWAERLAIEAICGRAKVDGIEGFGYGKGYMYAKEEFGKLLDRLEEVKNSGHNVVITAHAQITKFEQPDEMGSYDRWNMKTTKYVAPLLREWCDLLLFANYKSFVVKDGEGKMAKGKGQGGRTRVMYTTHHACWDAKNRFGLPEECPLDYAVIAPHVWVPPTENSAEFNQKKPVVPEAEPATVSASAMEKNSGKDSGEFRRNLLDNGVPERLADLMAANFVSERELQAVVGEKGFFPADMPVEDYPDFPGKPAEDFVGFLANNWAEVLKMVLKKRDDEDLPF